MVSANPVPPTVSAVPTVRSSARHALQMLLSTLVVSAPATQGSSGTSSRRIAMLAILAVVPAPDLQPPTVLPVWRTVVELRRTASVAVHPALSSLRLDSVSLVAEPVSPVWTVSRLALPANKVPFSWATLVSATQLLATVAAQLVTLLAVHVLVPHLNSAHLAKPAHFSLRECASAEVVSTSMPLESVSTARRPVSPATPLLGTAFPANQELSSPQAVLVLAEILTTWSTLQQDCASLAIVTPHVPCVRLQMLTIVFCARTAWF